MTDPFVLKAIFTLLIFAAAIALLVHSRRCKAIERER